MRLWTIHPRFMDKAGLGALWREGLLARAVLAGQTKGYKHHPQLTRFRGNGRRTDEQALPYLEGYLHTVVDEADRRGYHYDRTKLAVSPKAPRHELLEVTRGQLDYEIQWFNTKLLKRTGQTLSPENVYHHPMFVVVPGPVEAWEKV